MNRRPLLRKKQPMHFKCKKFAELSLTELYDLMALRQEVFVVEQNCPYLDADGKDQDSHHVLGENEAGELVAYTRLVPPGLAYEKYPAIGRVVTSPSIRGKGGGKKLMEKSIQYCDELWPGQSIKISAQTYLKKFYEDLGFQQSGGGYLEDDIPHIPMIRENS
jgi:ElaA protein